MKNTTKFIIAFCSFAALAVLAQTNGSTLPPLPTDIASFWDLAIAGLSPLIVWGVRKVVPSIPTVLLPSMTPFIGIGLGWILSVIGAHQFSWYDAAKAGALAVFVRETFHNAVSVPLANRVDKPVSN